MVQFLVMNYFSYLLHPQKDNNPGISLLFSDEPSPELFYETWLLPESKTNMTKDHCRQRSSTEHSIIIKPRCRSKIKHPKFKKWKM